MPFENPGWLPEKANVVETEAAIRAFWKDREVFRKSLALRAGRERFVFYEGPPTANGTPHPGHVLGRVMKDLFPRYRTMTGFDVPRKAGWDTHGLPVEIEVEKELGLTSKEDIEKFGVEPFVRKCMESVFRYTRDWEELTERIGFWLDMPSAYVTCTRDYVESVWWALSEIWKKGHLYQGHKIVPYCPRCGTALSSHEVGWGYRTVDDPSVVAKFKVKGRESTYLLAWTTTPWTLLSNAALAVHPEAEYAFAHGKDGQTWVLASSRVDAVLGEGAAVARTAKGAELAGWDYEPLFEAPGIDKRAHFVVTGGFVTLDDGTGVVHIAPAYGADDYEIGRKHDLPVINRVDARGVLTADTGPFAGMFVKDADKHIMDDLAGRGLLVSRATLRHEYPFCWRCDTPLLYYPREGWFIRTTSIRERMLGLNDTIKWYPEHIREGRFGNFLKDNIDWALSRERYWGTPLPIWKCACGRAEAVESLADLRSKGATGFEAFEAARAKDPSLSEHFAIHRPYIDAVKYPCVKCGGTMERVPEVVDCWFDSGSMPFAQWGYPFKGEDDFKAAFPADFICEAIDQTRGWFYSLLAVSTMLFDAAPYGNCVVHGHVCDEKGFKMSKSRGNYVDPKVILDAHGADAVRWYFLSANQPWASVRLFERAIGLAGKDFLVKLRNVVSFFRIYARIDGFDPAACLPVHGQAGGVPATSLRPGTWGERAGRRAVGERAPLDRWLLGELAITTAAVRRALDSYDAYGAAQMLSGFVESLSNWYLRRSRPRYWVAGLGPDKLDAYWTLYEALVTTTLLVAPFTPFVAEEFYQVLVGTVWKGSAPESVHLADYPRADEFPVDERLQAGMALAREAAALGRSARAQAKIKVRTPLSEASIVAPDAKDAELIGEFLEIVKDEINVKQVWPARRDPPQVRFQVKPDFRRLGPRLGENVKALAKVLAGLDGAEARTLLREKGKLVVEVAGADFDLGPDDLDVRASAAPGYAAASGPRLVVLVNTTLTDALRSEGLAREVVSRIQGMRKDLDLPYEARIETRVSGSGRVTAALEAHADFVRGETLSEALVVGTEAAPGAEAQTFDVEGEEVRIALRVV